MNQEYIREMRVILLQRQARAERALAAKQTDPAVKRLIENSIVGKLELAQEIRTGRPVEGSKYEKRDERSRPHKVVVKVR